MRSFSTRRAGPFGEDDEYSRYEHGLLTIAPEPFEERLARCSNATGGRRGRCYLSAALAICRSDAEFDHHE